MKALGVFREISNSPGRESDDARILRAAMGRLSDLGTQTSLMTPEEFDRADALGFDLIVPMCESYPRLMRLKALEAETGATVVNPADSVLGCYRARMLASFAATPGLNYPPTEVRRTSAEANSSAPAFEAPGGYWVKRGDVHNTCARDVVFARGWANVDEVRRDFESREIIQMAVQRHVDGDLIKFYGVGPGQWFTWFTHDPAASRCVSFDPAQLAAQAELAARAVRVEVFGGDAIAAPDGKILIIDINSWPSFARVREEAALQIARRLSARLRRDAAPQRRD